HQHILVHLMRLRPHRSTLFPYTTLFRSILTAYEKAFATDPESSFGGIIAFNRELDAATAQAITDKQFVEVIIAPSASAEAQQVVSAKKNVRLLVCEIGRASCRERVWMGGDGGGREKERRGTRRTCERG